MKCCVTGCKNESRRNSKSQGITFHVIPTEPTLRSSWLQALNKQEWELKEWSVVCSDHLFDNDLYYTKNGLRKLRTGAVPKSVSVEDMSSCEFGEQASLKMCRICLAVDSKLYSIYKYKLEESYKQLTGVSLSPKDNLPLALCYECAHRLVSCTSFRSKSLRANALLNQLMSSQGQLSQKAIKSIERESNQLTSPLQKKTYEPNHCDIYINSTDLHTDKPTITEVNVDDIDVKNETEFISEDIPEERVKEEICDEETCDEETTRDETRVEVNDQDEKVEEDEMRCDDVVDSDKDFAGSDEEFSSDDSLPLEISRSRKKKKTKLQKGDSVNKVRKRKLKIKNTEPKIDRRRKPFLNDDLNETLFTITDLTFEEQVAEILKRQDSANYKNAVFKCTECFKGFLDEDAYSGHMSRHTKDCGEYRCDICKTHFKHPHALRKHITAHHTQRFSCNQCPYVTTHRQTARLHERWHKGTKYQCPHCPDEFVKFTTYMGHIRIKHPSDFVCQLCGFSFVSAKGIELHKKLKHRLDSDEIPADGPYCAECGVRFVSAAAHAQHQRVSARHQHSDKEQRESNKPKKGRKSKEAKEREKRAREKNEKELGDNRRVFPSQVRKAEGPIPCEQCGMQLEDSRAYHGHFRRMHPDKNRTNYPSMKSPCMCEVCGRMFQSYALLKDHTWTHTGERPFKCDACDKSFRMKQRLVAHRRVHQQVKASYLCNLCGKHFSTHSNRQRHMFIHTGLKPFKCEMCGKCFKHASEKRAHVTYVHLKKPWPKRSRGKRRPDRPGPPNLQTGGASEMDVVQPLWAPCDPKLDHINNIIDDKPLYYNLKI